MKIYKDWTDEEKSTVIEMHKQGFSNEQIGNRLGRSKGSIACTKHQIIPRQLPINSWGRVCGSL